MGRSCGRLGRGNVGVVVMTLGAVGLLASPTWAERAAAFVTIGGTLVQGDATNKEDAGGIVVLGVDAALTRPVDPTGAVGAVQHTPLQIIKLPDRASPRLVKAAALGEAVQNVEIRFYRPSTTGQVLLYHTFILEDGVKIVEFRTSGDTTVPGGVTETVGFAYCQITVRDDLNKTPPTVFDFCQP